VAQQGDAVNELLPYVQMLTALMGLAVGVIGLFKVVRIEKNTNSMAERGEASARKEGNLTGRAEQTAERKAEEKLPPRITP
jgi:hypothetical protein